ncbi:MAG TPA: FecR family protein [Kofleriaceae bacterium]|nr:FecR family protein [Kofleriaceae bacterium]
MTTPLGRPSVEPLSDLAWGRVERDLMAALDRAPVAAPPPAPRRPWWPRAAIAGGLVAAAAIALLALWPRGGGPRHDLPSRVVTASAPTTVSFGDAAITIAPSSALVLGGRQDTGVAIVLERGSARFAVAPRAGRPPFVVHAGAVDVRVVGTEFTVTRSGDAARVDVAHGVVEVVGHGQRSLLQAGQSWHSDRVRDAALRGSDPTMQGDVAAALLLDAAQPAEPALAEPAEQAEPPPPAATARPRPGPPADPRAAFEAASALEASDPAGALRAYRALARGTGPWAANALYAAARLALDREDAALAARLARSYLARFPGGANAADAAAILERTQGAPE